MQLYVGLTGAEQVEAMALKVIAWFAREIDLQVAYMWFEFCCFTHLRCVLLDKRYPPRVFQFKKHFKPIKNN